MAALLLVALAALASPTLPRPTAANTLMVFVADPGLDVPDLTLEQKTARLRDLADRLDPRGLYVRVGVAINERPGAREVYEAASRARVPLAVLAGAAPHHTHTWLDAALAEDPANCQVLSDGTLGPGAQSGRLWATVSDLADAVVGARRAYTLALAQRIANRMQEWPGAIQLIVGPAEVGMSSGGYPDRYADYSPASVRQFRDWLTHRGLYAAGAPHGGRGYPGGEPYADDPSPADAAGGGASFNETMGTTFTTWDIAPYRPEVVPAPAARPEGAFDAPRNRAPGHRFWEAWLLFRRHLVARWTEAHVAWLVEGGLPPAMIAPTLFLPSDPMWRELAAVGDLPACPTGCVLMLDAAAAETLEFASEHSGIERWGALLSMPNSAVSGFVSESLLTDLLRPLVHAGCSTLVLRAWDRSGGASGPIAGTALEGQLRSYLGSRSDLPLGEPADTGYAPPPVREIAVTREGTDNIVTWSPRIFEDADARWEDWGSFRGFVVSRVAPTPQSLGVTSAYRIVDRNAPEGARYEVRARTS